LNGPLLGCITLRANAMKADHSLFTVTCHIFAISIRFSVRMRAKRLFMHWEACAAPTPAI
jgi:hypothetical protein